MDSGCFNMMRIYRNFLSWPIAVSYTWFSGIFTFSFLPYYFFYQRVNQCLRNACHDSSLYPNCKDFIDCGRGDGFSRFNSSSIWTNWTSNANATACFTSDGFAYGIYELAVNLTTEGSIVTKYIYALFWGFQVIFSLLLIFTVLPEWSHLIQAN